MNQPAVHPGSSVARDSAAVTYSRPGRGLALAASAAGLGYAAVSGYWAAGGTWLLSTVGAALGHQSGSSPGLEAAVWAAAVLKVVGAVLPLAAVGTGPGLTPPRRRQIRALAWAEAGLLTIYGLVLAGAGWLEQAGVIAPAAGADHRALAWHAFLWDPWFLVWGVLVTAALLRSRSAGRRSS